MNQTIRTSVDIQNWPELDRSLWRAALHVSTFLEPNGIAAHWADATKTQVQKGYGKWMHFLSTTGVLETEATVMPDLRITEERLRHYVQMLQEQGLASVTLVSRATDLQQALRVMNKGANLNLLSKLISSLQMRAVPSRNKHVRIREPLEILTAAQDYMASVIGSLPQDPTLEAAHYRDGLMLAFFAMRPIRKKNFASIVLGHHMVWNKERWSCAFSANETKEARPLSFFLPEDRSFNDNLNLYLTKYRPLLLGAPCQANKQIKDFTGPLWISKRKTQMSEQAIYCNICKLSKQLLGVRINPHLTRDCAASSLSVNAPEYILAAARILGHASLSTTISHYEQSSMLSAGARLTEFILSLQSEGADEPQDDLFDNPFEDPWEAT